MSSTRIAIQTWKPDRARPGYILPDERMSAREVESAIKALLAPLDPAVEYVSIGMVAPDVPWPEGRLFVASVPGGSEGDCVHVMVEDATGSRATRLLVKTFGGRDQAWADARAIADALEED